VSDPKDTKDRRRTTGGADEAAEREKALLPEFMRRALTLGLSGLFTTEEAFRRALGDTVPKDWVDFAADQSDRTRSELAGRLAEELARVVESMDLEELLRALLTEHRVEIRAEVNLVAREPESRSKRGKTRTESSSEVKIVRGGRRK
jgi:hypothetical protein